MKRLVDVDIATYTLIAVLCSASAIASIFLWETFERKDCKMPEFVNRDYACGRKHSVDKGGYISLRHVIEKYLALERDRGRVGTASVYFRDLRDGPVMGINETAAFAPASLMKLPLVFAFFHIDEDQGNGFLETKIPYTKIHDAAIPQLVQYEVPHTQLRSGELYTLRELLRNTIVYSDNDAYYTLIEFANRLHNGPLQVLETFQELGIVDPRTPDEEVVSVRSYATLFRLLYNVSYLNVAHSEEVLSWLADSVYTKGLRAGVPTSIRVAHKFGERELPDQRKLLHDCGIVFFPNNPYSLCVTVEGTSYPEMAHVIAEISRLTYEEVNSRVTW